MTKENKVNIYQDDSELEEVVPLPTLSDGDIACGIAPEEPPMRQEVLSHSKMFKLLDRMMRETKSRSEEQERMGCHFVLLGSLVERPPRASSSSYGDASAFLRGLKERQVSLTPPPPASSSTPPLPVRRR
ncbi:MAG: hypothetical protein A2X77_01425 [Gammaproteobacteria bacterium GWE2_42_36]|nr:MAG: hypothetical protein A2X77_01425 [Gammaproteobacteria bacterium GWE2_42_36]HCU05957.1 hypothetical protein [Coxiellaceae bacterium]